MVSPRYRVVTESNNATGENDMSGYDQTAKFYAAKNEKKLRELMRRDYGAGKYRLTHDGEVHAYGKMPNSIETGWYLLGYREEVERNFNI